MKKYDWQKAQEMYGKYTDREISNAIGASIYQVENDRRKKGIKPISMSKWLKYEHLLGIESDDLIAKKLRVGKRTVTRHRLRLGIFTINDGAESYLQREFIKTLHNYNEQVKTPLGKADIVDDTTIYELKFLLNTNSLHCAVGQLLTYSKFIKRDRLCIVTTKNLLNGQALDVLQELGISIIVFDITQNG